MPVMTVVDVAEIAYPGQRELGNIAFGQDGNNPIFITHWSVPNEPEPTIETLELMIPSLQKQFDMSYFLTAGQYQLMNYLDEVAAQRTYSSALACTSYANSSVLQWKAEADSFIVWRDDVFNYTLAQIALMQSDARSIPTFEEFKMELPVLIWP